MAKYGLPAGKVYLLLIKKKHSWKQFFKSEYFKKISIDVFGRLWLLNDDSLWSFDPKAPELKAFANHPSKKTPYISITSDADGKIWVGTLGGKLYYASAKKKEIDLAGDINKLSGSKNVLELRCLYVDDSGLLWIGTEGGGVIKINLNPPNFCIFPSLKNHPADNSLYVKSVFCDDDGKVWLGTFKKGVYILDPETSQASKFNIPANENFHKTADIVYSITKDNEGVYWLGYEGCLIAYNKTKHQFFFPQIPKTASNLTPSINQVSFQKGHMLLSTTAGLYMVIKHTAEKKQILK